MQDSNTTSGQSETLRSTSTSSLQPDTSSSTLAAYQLLTVKVLEDNGVLKADNKKLNNQLASLRSEVDKFKKLAVPLAAQLNKIEDDLPRIKSQVNSGTTKNFEILAIFVALFTFVSVEFQAFSHADRPLLLPISMVAGGVLLSFISLLSLITAEWDKWEVWRNVVRFVLLFAGAAFAVIGYASYRAYLDQYDTKPCSALAQQISRAASADLTTLSQKYSLVCK